MTKLENRERGTVTTRTFRRRLTRNSSKAHRATAPHTTQAGGGGGGRMAKRPSIQDGMAENKQVSWV